MHGQPFKLHVGAIVNSYQSPRVKHSGVVLRLRDTGPGEVTNLFEHGVDAQANIMFNRPQRSENPPSPSDTGANQAGRSGRGAGDATEAAQ